MAVVFDVQDPAQHEERVKVGIREGVRMQDRQPKDDQIRQVRDLPSQRGVRRP